MLSEFLSFIEETFSGTHSFRDSQYGKLLIIQNEDDIFKINLSDKVRFGKFTVYHRNSAKLLTGEYNYHVQLEARHLSYALWHIYVHKFHKTNHLFWSNEDYHRFMQDWMRYLEKKGALS